MKVCLLGADFETPNMGVAALTVGSVRATLHAHPETEIFILSYERSGKTYRIQLPGREVEVPLVNMRFSWRSWRGNNIAVLLLLTGLMKLLPFPALRRQWIAGNTCLQHLDQTDLVPAISGGDSFSDIYGLERLLYVSLPQILALWAGKRLILLPQTLGPFKSRLAKWLAGYIMKRAEVVYSRDRAGVELARQMIKDGTRDTGNGIRETDSPRRHKGTKDNGVRGPKSEVRGPEPRVPNPESRTPNPEPLVPSPKVRFCYDVGFVVDPIPPARLEIAGLTGFLTPEPRVPSPVSRDAHESAPSTVYLCRLPRRLPPRLSWA